MTNTTVLSLNSQPTILVGIDIVDARNRAMTAAQSGSIDISGIRIIATNRVVGWFHTVTDYRSVQTLKAAAELDSNGYPTHADALRVAVGQAEAMKRNGHPEWDAFMAELLGEAIDAASESSLP